MKANKKTYKQVFFGSYLASVLCLMLVAVCLASCKDDEEKNKFDITDISVESSYTAAVGEKIEIGGRGFISGDRIKLSENGGSKEYTAEALNITSSGLSFLVPAGMESGNYAMHCIRGGDNMLLRSPVKFTIVPDDIGGGVIREVEVEDLYEIEPGGSITIKGKGFKENEQILLTELVYAREYSITASEVTEQTLTFQAPQGLEESTYSLHAVREEEILLKRAFRIEFPPYEVKVVPVNPSLFRKDDQLGMFMFTCGEPLGAGSILNQADNVKYVADANGYLVGDQKITYPKNATVDLIMYYPWKPSSQLTNYVFKADVSDQTDQHAIGFFYSDNARGRINNQDAVNVAFEPLLSLATVNLTIGEGFDPSVLETLEFYFSGIPATADISLVDKTMSNVGPASSKLKFVRNSIEGNVGKYQMTLIPMPDGGMNRKFSVMIDGTRVLSLDLAEEAVFLPGKNSIFNVKLETYRIYLQDWEIVDWDASSEEKPGSTPPPVYVDRYNVGDYYPDPTANPSDPFANIEGIVFWLDPEGNGYSGKVVSLMEESSKEWAKVNDRTGAADLENGSFNTARVITYVNTSSQSLSSYPIFQWVVSTMNENSTVGKWYIPATNELQYLYCAMNGASPVTWEGSTPVEKNEQAREDFNRKLREARGVEIGCDSYMDVYWSSTENSSVPNMAHQLDFSSGSLDKMVEKNDNWFNKVRAVMNF